MNIKKGFSIAFVFIFSSLFLSAQNKVEKLIANQVEMLRQAISISGNVAVVRLRLDANTKDAGKPPAQIKLLILMVWQKDQGTWKLLARQAVKILS